jgi:hypothetical protein
MARLPESEAGAELAETFVPPDADFRIRGGHHELQART